MKLEFQLTTMNTQSPSPLILLPDELLGHIILYLKSSTERFRLATLCRSKLLQKQIILDQCEQDPSTPLTIYNAVARGQQSLLEWWAQAGIPWYWTIPDASAIRIDRVTDQQKKWFMVREKNTALALLLASKKGYIYALDWWNDNGLPFYLNTDIVDITSGLGRVDVLDWWKNWVAGQDGKRKLLHTDEALVAASQNNHLEVLDWWLRKPWCPSPSSTVVADSIKAACIEGHFDVLNWWKQNFPSQLQYARLDMYWLVSKCSPDVVKWILEISGAKMDVDGNAVDYISERGNADLLSKCLEHSPKLVYTIKAMNFASEFGHISVLDWWKGSGLELKYTNAAIDFASAAGKVESLEWWRNSGLELRYSSESIFSAIIMDKQEVVEWWSESGLKFEWPKMHDFGKNMPKWAEKYYYFHATTAISIPTSSVSDVNASHPATETSTTLDLKSLCIADLVPSTSNDMTSTPSTWMLKAGKNTHKKHYRPTDKKAKPLTPLKPKTRSSPPGPSHQKLFENKLDSLNGPPIFQFNTSFSFTPIAPVSKEDDNEISP